jgi:signal peptidase
MASEEEPSEDTADSEPSESTDGGNATIGLALTPVKWIGKQWYLWTRDLLIGAAIVLAIIGLATLILGIWPPMGAVSSGSMSPHINVGDAVVFSDTDRFQPEAADRHGVVTREAGIEHNFSSFGDYGMVIVFENPNAGGVEIMHRPMFYVEEGENWVKRANKDYLLDAESCSHFDNCPAPHDGYITKGDNNNYYDQAQIGQEPIKPQWVNGVVEAKVPAIGWLRVIFA